MAISPAWFSSARLRHARRWDLRLCLIYLGVVFLLLFLENKLVFRPTTAAEDWQPFPSGRSEDVELRLADGTPLHAWWCPIDHWKPEQGAVLYCHGNAGNLSHRGQGILRWQEQLQLPVLIFDYPGYGKSGGKPSEAGLYAAGFAAYDWLTRVGRVPPERIILYGGSLGGAVAIELATQKPHRALILVSAFTSIPDMAQKQFPWLPARWLVRNRCDNLSKIASCCRPVFIAHGTADRLVPFTQGERLFAAAQEPKRFFPMEGYDHNHTPGPDFYAELRRFLAVTDDAPKALASTNAKR